MKLFNQNISGYRVAFVLMLSSVIGLAYNLTSENGIDFEYKEISLESITETKSDEPNFDNISPIGTIEAYTMYEEGARFIDARDMWEFGEGHIAGALNFPYIEFEPDHEVLSLLDKEEKLIIYCGSKECGLSTKLAVELSKLGFKNLYVFSRGWDSWLAAGYPVSGEDSE